MIIDKIKKNISFGDESLDSSVIPCDYNEVIAHSPKTNVTLPIAIEPNDYPKDNDEVKGQLAVWDVRLSAYNKKGIMIKPEEIIYDIRDKCKKWTFQLEQAPSGYLHYQGRLSLHKKMIKKSALAMFKIKWNYFMPTTIKEFQRTAFYQIKYQTRVEGPWTDKDDDLDNDNIEEHYVPRQFRGLFDNLRPFQKQIYDSANVFEPRIINYIYCEKGNNGKSTIASICELMGKGVDLPPCNDADKLIQSFCNICMTKRMRDPSPVFIDLPRAMHKDAMNGIFAAVEQIKKGKLYDVRNKYKEWWIDSPQVWVFANVPPKTHLLSSDRWKIWIINDEYELIEYSEEIHKLNIIECDDGRTEIILR